jgi:hypothetical protein
MRSFTSARNAPYTLKHQIEPSAPMEYDTGMCSAGCQRAQKILVCYTPADNSNGTVSCVSDRADPYVMFTTDKRAAVIPAGAIIDSVEFFGINGFSTKDVFSIGFGQLNQDIQFPLIIDAEPAVANERVGGFREFNSFHPDGRNEKNIVILPSFVNVDLGEPITCGSLQIVIRYHMKIV